MRLLANHLFYKRTSDVSVIRMDSLPPAISSDRFWSPRLPSGRLSRGRGCDRDGTAAFAAGIALKSLDDLVRLDPVWAGCWRSRQALKCAAAAVRLMGPQRGRTRFA